MLHQSATRVASGYSRRWPVHLVLALVVGALGAVLPVDPAGEAVADAQETMAVTDLGTLGGTFSTATDVNELGQVVGNSLTGGGESHGFFWTAQQSMVDIGTLGGNSSVALAVNDLGQVVGRSRIEMGTPRSHAFVWTLDGGMVSLGSMGGIDSYGFDVNNLGQVVGYIYYHYPSGDSPAFMWTAEGGPIILGTLGGNLGHRPNAINELGQVVGAGHTAAGEHHGFFWSEATGMLDIGTLGGVYSEAEDVNELGQVVGASFDAAGFYRAFLWTLDGGMVDLGTLPDTDSCRATAISNSGQTVGICWTSSTGYSRAFSWTAESGMVDLGDLGLPASAAYDVNDFGQIVGYSTTTAPEFHAILWTAEGGLTDLGSAGGAGSQAFTINNSGHAVGHSAFPDGNHATLWTVPLPPQTPVEQIEAIASEVADLVADLALNPGEGDALLATLDGAANQLDDGNTTPGCNMLDAFINQINAKVNSGQLSSVQGQELINLAEGVDVCS